MMSWSKTPEIWYSTKSIQALGDAPFRNADAVVVAVDSQSARNYIGRKAAQHGVPLVEGGFSGSHVNSIILLNDLPDGPCWHCNLYQTNDRNREIQLSCTRAAKQAEENGFVPAIQSAAAYLGAFVTETTIQFLHGRSELGNTQVVMDMRTGGSSVARLQPNPDCGSCCPPQDIALRIRVDQDTNCEQLLNELERQVSDPVVSLPFSYLVRGGCAQCKRPISVNQPDWVMRDLLFCRDCGGKWTRVDQPGIETYPTLSRSTEPLLERPISDLGLLLGSLIEVESDNQDLFFELECDSNLPFFTKVTPGGS